MKPDQLNILLHCPVCNSKNLKTFISSKDFFLTNKEFNIDLCTNCGIKFTNPQPLIDRIPEYYNSDQYISHTNSNIGFINKIYHIVRSYAIKGKVRLVKKYFSKGSVLDIGCGTGEFLNELQNQNFIVTGVEPNQLARTKAIHNYGLNIISETDINSLNQNIFDVITMWHVLEHVYDLDERIRHIRNLLSDNGILIIAVPNSGSWDAAYYNKYWAAYDLPRHLFHFNKKSLSNLFEKYGFKLVKTKPMIFDSFYISILSEKYKSGKSNFFKGILMGTISNLSGFINEKNYSSVIHIFKLNNI